MIEKISVKNSIVCYEPSSRAKKIYDILLWRFWEDHLVPKTLDDLHDPFLMKDMDKAVNRIQLAIEKKEKVMIFWDYDVDGVTSTSILMHFFKKIWLQASYRLPHRVHDWYGLKKYFIDEIKLLWVSLIVTVDCGTKDSDVIAHAKKLWLDIIVTDHHSVPEVLSQDAVAIINPHRWDCQYPFKWLAGAWVAFKLMSALSSQIFDETEHKRYLIESVDICAIGTVADCMQIVWENRIIVTEWLKQIKNSRSIGLRRLIEDSIETEIDADIFGFTIWPRLNAAGRMDSPYKAVNLILNNSSTINQTIIEIEKLNNLRKGHTKVYVEEAVWKIDRNDNLLIYESKDIEHGIIGIVAGRLTEQFYKPSMVFKDEWDTFVWSCRSPDYFSIIELLDWYKEYFIGYWGHKQAAGLSMSKENFPKFKKAILKNVNKRDFKQYKKKIFIDKVVNSSELWFWFLGDINKFKPFGMWNTKPLFLIENLSYEKIEFLGQGRDHIKFTTKDGFKIFAFFMWEYYDEIKRKRWKVSIVFDLSEDNWMWKKNLMLKVIDIILE